MLVNIFGLVMVILFAIIGYSRGLYKILAVYLSFFVAALLAKPASISILWLVKMTGKVPSALIPIAGQLLAGLILFLLFNHFTDRILRNREDVREQLNQPRMATWEQPGGAIMGSAWGFFLVVLILTGLHLIGSVEEIMIQPSQSTIAGSMSGNVSQYNEKQQNAEAGIFSISMIKFGEVKRQIEYSAFGTLAQKADPVDDRVKAIFHNLKTVVNNSNLRESFKHHPVIAYFANNPKIQDLLNSVEIQYMIDTGQYYELLDNVKIVSLLNDENLYRELKNVNLGEILEKIIADGF